MKFLILIAFDLIIESIIKTGTTDTDVWIVGYNKNAVLSIWNGYDNNKKINNGEHNYHKNIWIDTMESYLKDKDKYKDKLQWVYKWGDCFLCDLFLCVFLFSFFLVIPP